MIRHLHQRGVSLLEALVAMTVMAIGAVSVVGMQATLRMNGDAAKQRAEGVRQAQQLLETWRGYTDFAAVADVVDWTDIVNVSSTATPPNSNATYTRTVTVVPSGEADDNPRAKTVHVLVAWTDRANVVQSVALNSIITGAHPELGGSLSIPAGNSLLRNPGGRNPAIPLSALPYGVGSSSFHPPGSPSTLAWIFSNTTGLVTQICTDISDATTCADANAMLLSGFIRFSTGFSQPTATQSEAPSSSAEPITISVSQTQPFTTTVPCFVSLVETTSTAYFCLLTVNPPTSPNWSGTTIFGGVALASSIADPNDNHFKVCRYTTVRSNSATVPADLKNEDNPLNYVNVSASLSNQNYLLIRAGDDNIAYACPDDNTSSPNVNTATWHHQPAN